MTVLPKSLTSGSSELMGRWASLLRNMGKIPRRRYINLKHMRVKILIYFKSSLKQIRLLFLWDHLSSTFFERGPIKAKQRMESTWLKNLVKVDKRNVGDRIRYGFEDEDSQHRRPLEYQVSARSHFLTSLVKHRKVNDQSNLAPSCCWQRGTPITSRTTKLTKKTKKPKRQAPTAIRSGLWLEIGLSPYLQVKLFITSGV